MPACRSLSLGALIPAAMILLACSGSGGTPPAATVAAPAEAPPGAKAAGPAHQAQPPRHEPTGHLKSRGGEGRLRRAN